MGLKRRELWMGPHETFGTEEWAKFVMIQTLMGGGAVYENEVELAAKVLEGKMTKEEVVEAVKRHHIDYDNNGFSKEPT